MQRTASVFGIALGITAIIVATIVRLAPLAGEAVLAHIRQTPDGPLWTRLLTPMLPAFSIAVFGLVAAARRRKAARVGSGAATPAGCIGA